MTSFWVSEKRAFCPLEPINIAFMVSATVHHRISSAHKVPFRVNQFMFETGGVELFGFTIILN